MFFLLFPTNRCIGFSLIMHIHISTVLWHCWFGVRESIRPIENWVIRCCYGYLCGVKCRWFAYGPADATAIPSSHAALKSRMVLPFWCRLTEIVLESRPLNKCCCCCCCCYCCMHIHVAIKVFFIIHAFYLTFCPLCIIRQLSLSCPCHFRSAFTVRGYPSVSLAIVVCLFVHLSVRPSVTHQYCIRTAKRRILQAM